MRNSSALVQLAAGVATLALVAASPAAAKIITVTGTGDAIVVDGFVTLREAITAANTNAPSGDAPAGDSGLDTIRFNIAGLPGTVHRIQPQSALPTITQALVIDGYSQLGASANTLASGDNAFLAIELDGTQSGFNAGLAISAGGSTVQGLVINNFKNEGLLVFTSGGNTIRGNFLGTDATGKLDRGNGVAGVSLLSSGNVVGGLAPADRNVISGNDFAGITIVNAGVSGNVIQGNLIGTDDTGAAALANTGAGIRVVNAAANTIGGTAPGAGNVIAFNTGVGILIASSAGTGIAILGNSIFSNGGLGIDLDNDGVTTNDDPAGLDADTGPNGLQNFPVLVGVTSNSAGTTVSGNLFSAAATPYRVELFASPTCDDSGNGEGRTFLGAATVTTGATGQGTFTIQTTVPVPNGQIVTATATDPVNSTSEFSPCKVVGVAVPASTPLGLAALLAMLALAAWMRARQVAA